VFVPEGVKHFTLARFGSAYALLRTEEERDEPTNRSPDAGAARSPRPDRDASLPVLIAIFAALLLALPGCARVDKAEDVGRDKALHLERERVLKDLQEQEQAMDALRQELAGQEQTLTEMQARMAAGEAVPEKEREEATRDLKRLSKELKDVRESHAQTLQDAEKLGISPGQTAPSAAAP
jgi:septal ring factor EnvC (AmiA/AmiB activator)